MKTVREAAKLAGVSVRTLHHYDKTGLLPPSGTTPAGYRLYDDTAMERLGHILFLRELDFSLGEIKAILESGRFRDREALQKHRELLTLKRDRLNGLIDAVDGLLKGEQKMDFEAFDDTAIKRAKAQYADEARQRWGGTDAYAQSEARTAAYTKEDWKRITEEANGIYAQFARQMELGPGHPEVQKTVRRWQRHITDHYYNCTDEILAGLGEMYEADERFRQSIDAHGEGLARFMAAAIRAVSR